METSQALEPACPHSCLGLWRRFTEPLLQVGHSARCGLARREREAQAVPSLTAPPCDVVGLVCGWLRRRCLVPYTQGWHARLYRSQIRDCRPGERAVTQVGRKSHQCQVLGSRACEVGGHVSSASGFFWPGSGVWAAKTCLVSVCIFLDDCGKPCPAHIYLFQNFICKFFPCSFFFPWHCQPNNLKSHVTALYDIFKEFLKVVNKIHNSKVLIYKYYMRTITYTHRHTCAHAQSHTHIMLGPFARLSAVPVQNRSSWRTQVSHAKSFWPSWSWRAAPWSGNHSFLGAEMTHQETVKEGRGKLGGSGARL